MKIACLDIETLGTESNSVILSAAICFVDLESESFSINGLFENTLFVKFSVREQVEVYGRKTDRSTIDWWNKQCDIVKKNSFFPSKSDLPAKEGLTVLKAYIEEQCNPQETIVFIRGSLDQVATDSLCKAVEMEPLFPYHVYRDCRTYIECMSSTAKRGYCDVNPNIFQDYNRENIIKHRPQDDVVLDLAQIISCE